MSISEQNSRQIQAMCRNIRALRIERGFTVEQTSSAAGISAKLLRQLENGLLTDEMTVDILFSLVDCFRIKPHEFFVPAK